MLNRTACCAVISLAVLIGAGARAQTYPSSRITIAVPTPAGGPMDTMMRALAMKLSENVGQPVIIDNKTGASGIIATQSVLQVPADGYSVAGVYLSHATNLHTNPRLPYDTLTSFAPVMLVAKGPNVLVVHKDVPATTVAELIAYAKAHPGKLNVGASTTGGGSHLGAELLKMMTGIDMQTVPYKGTAALIPDLITGRVEVTLDSYQQYLPFAKEGSIRMIGVSSAQRFEIDPSIPAIAETVPGYEALGWWGLVVNAATPPAIVARLHDEAARALADSGVQEKIRAIGVVPGGGSAAAFAAFIRSEIDKWKPVVEKAGLVEK